MGSRSPVFRGDDSGYLHDRWQAVRRHRDIRGQRPEGSARLSVCSFRFAIVLRRECVLSVVKFAWRRLAPEAAGIPRVRHLVARRYPLYPQRRDLVFEFLHGFAVLGPPKPKEGLDGAPGT
jgi:hypothetical protein